MQIDGLVHVIGWSVIAIGEPVFEDFLFGRAELEANIALDRGNAVPDEVVLIAADERVAKRLGIGDGFDAHGLRYGRGPRAEV